MASSLSGWLQAPDDDNAFAAFRTIDAFEQRGHDLGAVLGIVIADFLSVPDSVELVQEEDRPHVPARLTKTALHGLRREFGQEPQGLYEDFERNLEHMAMSGGLRHLISVAPPHHISARSMHGRIFDWRTCCGCRSHLPDTRHGSYRTYFPPLSLFVPSCLPTSVGTAVGVPYYIHHYCRLRWRMAIEPQRRMQLADYWSATALPRRKRASTAMPNIPLV